jgi:hypothetical protein
MATGSFGSEPTTDPLDVLAVDFFAALNERDDGAVAASIRSAAMPSTGVASLKVSGTSRHALP